jgi:RNA polymerase sigma-70 factor (ECF subfamily)
VLRDEVLTILRERIVAFAAFRYSRDAAEDLAQEVLMVLHEKYAQVAAIEELVPLSIQILRFKIAGLRRKTVRHGEYSSVSVDDFPLPDPTPSPAAQAERKQELDRLSAALSRLGERCRELFRLKLEGHNFGEIRKRMGAGSINTVCYFDLPPATDGAMDRGGRAVTPEDARNSWRLRHGTGG